MVCTNAHSRTVLLAYFHQGCELLPYPIEFCIVFAIGIFNYLKAFLVRIVAGIDAYLFNNASSEFSGVGCKVYVGHQRCVVASCPEFVANSLQVTCLLNAWRS